MSPRTAMPASSIITERLGSQRRLPLDGNMFVARRGLDQMPAGRRCLPAIRIGRRRLTSTAPKRWRRERRFSTVLQPTACLDAEFLAGEHGRDIDLFPVHADAAAGGDQDVAPRAEDLADHRQSVRHEIVTHVLGTFCHPPRRTCGIVVSLVGFEPTTFRL
jgi:hypothetical protein